MNNSIDTKCNLLNLPVDVLEKILSYISYDEVSRCRLVCQKFNAVSKRVLNHGFHRVEKYHAQCLRHVKSQLPRRESERRKHPLARHCDILTAVETRLSLLGMTFLKFMEMNLCCFIPGKVLDEIYKVLRYVTKEQTPVRAHEILQELRDLSSMAMEHFDEKISPAFRKRKDSGPKIISSVSIFSAPLSHHSKSRRDEHRSHKWKEEIRNISQRQTLSRKEMQLVKQRVAEVHKQNGELEKKVHDLQNLLSTQVEKIKDQDLKIEFLTRSMENKMFSLPKETGKPLGRKIEEQPVQIQQPMVRGRPRRQKTSLEAEEQMATKQSCQPRAKRTATEVAEQPVKRCSSRIAEKRRKVNMQ